MADRTRYTAPLAASSQARAAATPATPRRRYILTRKQSLVSGLLLFLAAAPSVHPQSTSDALTHATSLIRAGQLDAAIAEIDRALRTDPSDPRLHTAEGVAYSIKGDSTRALAALQAALEARPGFPAALRAKAEILTRLHSPEAQPVLEQILAASPGDTIAREMLANEQARAGQCQAAMSNYEAAAPALESHPASLLAYGTCLFTEKNYEPSVPIFARLSALQPASVEDRYDLALAQERAGLHQAAADTLTPLLNDTADPDTLSLASDIFESLGSTPRAIAVLRQAIVQQPGDSDSYVRFAELCMLHESYQAGIAMVSAGIARLPQSSALYLARGMLYGGAGDYDKAEADFRSAETIDPVHGTGAYGVGLVQSQRNDPARALATTREALRTHPDDPQLNFLLARLLIEGGEQPGSPAFAEAKACAEKAVRLNPGLLSARNLLAKVYTLAGQIPQAIEQCRAALAIDPSDQTAMYRLLTASRKIGDTATAEDLARRLAEEHQRARNDESNRLRYRVVEAGSPQAQGSQAPPSPAPPAPGHP